MVWVLDGILVIEMTMTLFNRHHLDSVYCARVDDGSTSINFKFEDSDGCVCGDCPGKLIIRLFPMIQHSDSYTIHTWRSHEMADAV